MSSNGNKGLATAGAVSSPICGAIKYVFSLRRKEWVETTTNIRVVTPNTMFSKGGMRICFEVEDVEEDGGRTPCIAKVFGKNISDVVEKDYFSEGEAQCMCEEFANNFNRARFTGENRPHVSFLQCQVVRIRKRDIPQEFRNSRMGFFSYRTQDTQEVMFVMEPKLHGTFTKYNSNFGDAYASDKHFRTTSQVNRRTYMFYIAEAFSHFTLVESGCSMLLCDIQGVNDLFTDPQIHTEDGRGLGMGNMGAEGIEKWVKTHVCNDICRALNLRPLLGVRPQTDNQTLEENFYVLLRADMQRNLILPQRPIEDMNEEERMEYAIKLSMMAK